MVRTFLIICLVEVLCLVGCAADYFLKIAGGQAGFFSNRLFLLGFVLHSSTAIGWFFALKYLNLSQIGVLYSISIVLILTATGVIFFNESPTPREYVGIGLAICSLLLLVRFQ